MPDAVFLLSSLPSPTASYLVTRHGYRLVPLPFAEAFALRSLAEPARDHEHVPAGGRIVMGRIQGVTVPAFTYGVEPAVPERPLPTLGARLLFVAHQDVPPRAVLQLVEATYGAEFGQVVRPPLDSRLMDLPPEFPWHGGAVLYQQRNAPLLSGAAMDSAYKAVAILAAAASGLFVLWQWFKLRSQFLRDRGFIKYINKVAYIETTASCVERDQIGGLALLHELCDQLAELKSEALARFTDGALSGHELMQGFLAQADSVRAYLQDLIRRQDGGRPAGMAHAARETP
jgi:hypothetical protein